jgi:hypothetical protein
MFSTRVLTVVVAGALLAGSAACSSPTSPDGPFRAELTLQPGQVTAVASTPLRVGFERVASDSRCPADALCIQSGDALVVFRVSVDDRAAADISLRTRGGTTGENLTAVVAGYELSIGGLQPYPLSSSPIAPGDYRVTLVVEKDS